MPVYIFGEGLNQDRIRTEEEITDFLKPGDILINYGFRRSLQTIGQEIGMLGGRRRGTGDPAAAHAAMYTGDGTVTEAAGRGLRCVPFSDYAVVFGGRVNVYRCKYQKLARQAADIAKQWAPRADHNVEEVFAEGRAGVSWIGPAFFGRNAKYRAIKYAARRLLDTPTHRGGVFCSMYVTMCYQAAALMEYVSPIRHGHRDAQKANFNWADAVRYWREGSLRDWNDADFRMIFTEAFFVDAKYVTPRLLSALVEGDPNNWRSCGHFINLYKLLRDAENYLIPAELTEYTSGDQPILIQARGGEGLDEDDLWELAKRHLFIDSLDDQSDARQFAMLYYQILTNRINSRANPLPVDEKRQYFIDYQTKIPHIMKNEGNRFDEPLAELLWSLAQEDIWFDDREYILLYSNSFQRYISNLPIDRQGTWIRRYLDNLTFMRDEGTMIHLFTYPLFRLSVFEEYVNDPRLRPIYEDFITGIDAWSPWNMRFMQREQRVFEQAWSRRGYNLGTAFTFPAYRKIEQEVRDLLRNF